MPLYQHIVLTLPKYSAEGLADAFKRYARVIMGNNGVLRGIENNGVRPLQERAKRKYATPDGTRYFWEARYVTTTFDASPECLAEAERALKNEDGVLRFFTTKLSSGFDKSKEKSYRNPYMPPKVDVKNMK
eukprot:gene9582-12906_t